MLISRNWLQTFFDAPLPDAPELEKALMFHAFEIDGIEKLRHPQSQFEDDILDVKVTPNRGHDCLCHLGIAKEVAAIMRLPLRANLHSGSGLKEEVSLKYRQLKSECLSVSIETPLCSRYIAGYIQGVKVGPSPEWLRHRLEAIGQRSINNVVDATNYVMFELGQPLHAFDASKLAQKNSTFAISVRPAKHNEKLLALDEKEYTLSDSMTVIADANQDEVIGIAGVKGGMPAGITEETTDIILEAANFDGVSVRKTAQALKLRTDASHRFEQQISPELAAKGMQTVVKLIQHLAGGVNKGFVDVYPNPQISIQVSVTPKQVQQLLGSTFKDADITDSFDRLGFTYLKKDDEYVVHVPSERLDLTTPVDLVEEVGRIQGYDLVPALPLPNDAIPRNILEVNKNFYWSEKIRAVLAENGFSEVFTSVFSETGERVVLNKVDGVKPYLRKDFTRGLSDALDKNTTHKDLLGVSQVKLFEIGVVWEKAEEYLLLGLAVEPVKKAKKTATYLLELASSLGQTNLLLEPNEFNAEVEIKVGDLVLGLPTPISYEKFPLSTTSRYQPFSRYPYSIRDVAFWTLGNTDTKKIEEMIRGEAGELCSKLSLFDTFTKEGKTSLAYRLIFQSPERTLVESEVQTQMEKVYAKLKSEGFEIR